MATSKEKFELVFEARENASRKIIALRKELKALGGPTLVKSQKEINKLQREINSLGKSASKNIGIFTRFTRGIAAGNIIANAATSAFRLFVSGIREIGRATVIAAEVEELGNVLQFVGQQAGFSSAELTKTVLTLRKNGIAQKQSNQAVLRGIQGNIALTDTIKLGRIAQDAAVIGQINSSDAFQTLIDAVVKGRVVMLKSLGIQGTFENEYKKLAKTLGKAAVNLTNAEKKTARLNLVFAGGKVIAGAYETAMGSASKQLRSMDRLTQDLQISIGKHLVPSMSVVVTEMSNFLRVSTKAFSPDLNTNTQTIGVSIGIFTANIVFAAKAMFNFGQIALDAVQLGVIAPIEAALVVALSLFQLMKDPFSIENWKRSGEILGGVLDGFETGWEGIKGNIDDIDDALLVYENTVKRLKETPLSSLVTPEAVGGGGGKGDSTGIDLSKMIAEAAEAANVAEAAHMESFVARMHTKQRILRETAQTSIDVAVEASAEATNAISKTARQAASDVGKSTSIMQGILSRGVTSMIGSLVRGRSSMGEIFKGMAQDFMTFFIKKALSMLITAYIPGLKGILGGIFDTPTNDRMAADQGRDFMQWFTKGALAEAQGGTELAVGISGASNRIAPVAAGGGNGGGGMVVMNVTVSGNVLSDDFIENTISPKLQRLITSGRSLLSIQDENITGGRDVQIS